MTATVAAAADAAAAAVAAGLAVLLDSGEWPRVTALVEKVSANSEHVWSKGKHTLPGTKQRRPRYNYWAR